MALLSEIFLSIQGESTFTGLPCIFVRFSGCNLSCVYCDTPDADYHSFPMQPSEIVSHIKSYEPVKLVEITGGEPLLQEDVYELMSLLEAAGYKVLLETNGSITIARVPAYVVKIVDVKSPTDNELSSFLLKNLTYLNPQDELKFVIGSRQDYLFAKDFSEQHLTGFKNTILFSPVSGSIKPELLAEWILQDRLPVRMQVQLHKVIWGADRKGV